MNRITITCLSVVTLLTVGCKEQGPLIDEPVQRAAVPEVMIPSQVPPRENITQIMQSDLSEREKKALMDQWLDVSEQAGRLGEQLRQMTDWRAAHRLAQTAIEVNATQRFQSNLQQVVGNTMLSTHLLRSDKSQDRLEAISYYTDILIHQNHPDASVLLPALKELDSYWPAGKFDLALSKVIENTSGFLSRQACTVCEEQPGKTAEEIPDVQQRRLYVMQRALEELKAMVQSSAR